MTDEVQEVEAEEIGTGLVRRTQIEDISVLSELTRAEVDIQVSTAKNYPRSIQTFQEELYGLVTMDQETADSMYYGIKRGGKWIEGPSVRFAECVAYSWTNLRSEGRVIHEGKKTLTAQGLCWDMERNVGARIEVQRRITDKNGNRYNDDMIVVTGNAAVSIAIRNAIFDVVPAALARQAFKAALATATGKHSSMDERRDSILAHFAELEVDAEDVFRVLGVRGKADIGAKEIRRLIGIKNAIEDGDTTADDVFSDPRRSGEVDDLNERLRARSKEREKSPEKAEEPSGATTPPPEPLEAVEGQEDPPTAPKPKPPTKHQQGVFDGATQYAELLAEKSVLDFDDIEALKDALEGRDLATLKMIRDRLKGQLEALRNPKAPPPYKKPEEGKR